MDSKRNRFQVNRVDSFNASGHEQHSQTNKSNNPSLISYKTDSIGSCGDSEGNCDSPSKLISNNNARANEYITSPNNHNSVSYDTKYGKSFRHFYTRECLPNLDNYRNIQSIQAAYRPTRPTLEELHNITIHDKNSSEESIETSKELPNKGSIKFGWIKGVFVRCLLNIWGVMLFLRLSWVVGQAGIIQGCLIILLATCVTILTGLSMSAITTNGEIKGVGGLLIILSTSIVTIITSLSLSAICTNGLVKSGGTYFMITRTLGPQLGGGIGVIFSLANAVACSMYVVGFAESLVDLLESLDTYIVPDPSNSIRIIGTVTVVILTGVVLIGMEWESKTQIALLIILLAAMVSFLVGSIVGPLNEEEISKGFVGFNTTVFLKNLMPDYRVFEGSEQNFFSVFSIFFPAATGILAGANISGDLKDPQYSIPKGTMLAILVTTFSYLLFALIVGSVCLRDATGIIGNETYDELLHSFSFQNCTNSTQCNWGLMNSAQVMELISIWGPLIYAGTFAATLSSALASLVSAPKIFQALCKDELYPFIKFFGKPYGKNNEPIRGYVLTFFIALAFILIAKLNAIAPLISNFFLAAYCLINFSTFHASLTKSVGWRPTFKYYNMWLSLVGFILCVAVMFLISWSTALITFGSIIALYFIVVYRKPDVNWGSSTQAQSYNSALKSVQDLNLVESHVKNYTPQILCFSGLPSHRPVLIDFAHLISKNYMIITGHILNNNLNNRQRTLLTQKAQNWFKTQKIKAFYSLVQDMDFENGANALLQASGLGQKLKPNILLLGYKNDWQTCAKEELLSYFEVIHKALDLQTSIMILRVENGLDLSKKITYGDDLLNLNIGHNGKNKNSSNDSLPHYDSNSQISNGSSGEINLSNGGKTEIIKRSKLKLQKNPGIYYKSIEGDQIPKEILDNLMMFRKKSKANSKIFDVFWLFDDGGLTLLIPFLISKRSIFTGCKLRVFALAKKADQVDIDQRSMAELLAKFRIDFSDLQIISDINKKPKENTILLFNSLISTFTQKIQGEENDAKISKDELVSMKDKTYRHMRLREILLEYSKNSSMIFMTLPIPARSFNNRRSGVSAPLYMSWLELLTKGLPPFVLIRGNQTSVLTYYS